MKFTATILTTAILTGSSLAAPRSGLIDRLQARGALSHQSLPAEKKGVLLKEGTQRAKVQYSKNWAGVVREKPPPSATYTAVSATFTVPEPTATDDSGEMQAVSAWVGIDGDTYTKAILQTGIDAYIQNGKQTFDAWYEWYPLSAENFDLELSAGDVVVAKVESYSSSKGVAIVENQSSGQSVTKTLSAPSTSATLAGQNAEWIVEDFNVGNSMVPLVNFGKVDFTGAQAWAGGANYGVDDGAILDIQQNGDVKAHVEVISDTEFSVTYQ
ncbi:Concanavalin A-like lectin/glucanases superfamily [Penicillium cf. griseofulvum]|uniref:Concanavalin A-like lectin/glucanases superfamily n=1 Tax=Penicillium cf. griseofulvum TaxID=2972120 RepID=A0A9W9T546_9EURO|nr:Concanavalin A-like lectin/glucanases superfamily [Penicillium cf. griseofulvum]KAJ5421248.1 Concanavalin A-like lectin/glucanases superfamily [Penicillium cf. griseofulvum]KAJ5424484.1 Concanavalin A-like lectin/glucanases superfamily [Penicillium cf. griseofulvum]